VLALPLSSRCSSRSSGCARPAHSVDVDAQLAGVFGSRPCSRR
jgi:hypothetical protein